MHFFIFTTLAASALAATVTVNVFSDGECQNLIESANLGNLNECHTVPNGLSGGSFSTSNVDSSFFGRGIKLVALDNFCGGEQADADFVDLTNNPNCHPFQIRAFELQ
jgi:hypothetical protein